IVPGISRVAVILDSSLAPNRQVYGELQAAAIAMGLALEPIEAKRAEDIDSAFAAAAARVGGAIVVNRPIVFRYIATFADAAARHKVRAVYSDPTFVGAGALLGYGASVPDLYRRAASYVDRILKGAKPGDLPIEQADKFDLKLNMKAAKALGITI